MSYSIWDLWSDCLPTEKDLEENQVDTHLDLFVNNLKQKYNQNTEYKVLQLISYLLRQLNEDGSLIEACKDLLQNDSDDYTDVMIISTLLSEGWLCSESYFTINGHNRYKFFSTIDLLPTPTYNISKSFRAFTAI